MRSNPPSRNAPASGMAVTNYETPAAGHGQSRRQFPESDMKFQSNPAPFKPISILLETEEDIVAVHALLNHARLTRIAGISVSASSELAGANARAGNPSIDKKSAELHAKLCERIS